MRRGDIWTAAGGTEYLGKPRPVAILQDDSFGWTDSVTICAFTTVSKDAPLIRIVIEPTARNGLLEPSSLMVEKISTMPRSKLGRHIGRLDDEDILRLNRAVLVFLGLAGPARQDRAS
jgi:mRNA interferase MazF